MAGATSLRGASVDQRLPTRRTSPRRSKSCSRASASSRLRPAARAAIAVESEPGSLPSAARRRSGPGRSRAPHRAAAPARAAQPRRERVPNGGAGFASHRRIVPEAGSAAATHKQRAPPGRPDDLKPTPTTTGAAHAAAVRRSLPRSGLRYATALYPSPENVVAPPRKRSQLRRPWPPEPGGLVDAEACGRGSIGADPPGPEPARPPLCLLEQSCVDRQTARSQVVQLEDRGITDAGGGSVARAATRRAFAPGRRIRRPANTPRTLGSSRRKSRWCAVVGYRSSDYYLLVEDRLCGRWSVPGRSTPSANSWAAGSPCTTAKQRHLAAIPLGEGWHHAPRVCRSVFHGLTRWAAAPGQRSRRLRTGAVVLSGSLRAGLQLPGRVPRARVARRRC
jgi:hypothetical protein